MQNISMFQNFQMFWVKPTCFSHRKIFRSLPLWLRNCAIFWPFNLKLSRFYAFFLLNPPSPPSKMLLMVWMGEGLKIWGPTKQKNKIKNHRHFNAINLIIMWLKYFFKYFYYYLIKKKNIFVWLGVYSILYSTFKVTAFCMCFCIYFKLDYFSKNSSHFTFYGKP